MQIAKELNYSYGYILDQPLVATAQWMTTLSNQHWMPWAPCSQSPGCAGRVSGRPLPQPHQPRLKLCCKLSCSTPGEATSWRNRGYGCGFQRPLLALWQLTHPLCPAWHAQWCDIESPHQTTPRGRICWKKNWGGNWVSERSVPPPVQGRLPQNMVHTWP